MHMLNAYMFCKTLKLGLTKMSYNMGLQGWRTDKTDGWFKKGVRTYMYMFRNNLETLRIRTGMSHKCRMHC